MTNATEAMGPADIPTRSELLQPHRIALLAIAAGLIGWAALALDWSWLPDYWTEILAGVGVTLVMLVTTIVLGFLLAVPVGLVQVTGPLPLKWLARAFCTVIRGTPVLVQLWFVYYGLGSLFPEYPWIRESALWPYLRESWPYAVFALTLSFAGYEGEVMRGAFAGVPRGEMEAARAFGMSRWKLLRRIWLPRALHRALPTLTGEMVLQLKATPLVATIAVMDVFAVMTRVRPGHLHHLRAAPAARRNLHADHRGAGAVLPPLREPVPDPRGLTWTPRRATTCPS